MLRLEETCFLKKVIWKKPKRNSTPNAPLSKCCPKSQFLTRHAHTSPYLTYASTVWDGYSDILFHKLNSLQRRAAKLMMPDLSLTTDAKLQRLGLLPLREKLMLNKAVPVFKAFRNLAPKYLKNLFIYHNSRTPPRSMILPKPRIDLFKTSFSYAGWSLWNSIPACLTSCIALSSFKNSAPQMAQE